MSIGITTLFRREKNLTQPERVDIANIRKVADKINSKYNRVRFSAIDAETTARKAGFVIEYVGDLATPQVVALEKNGHKKILVSTNKATLQPLAHMFEYWKNFGIAHLIGHAMLGHDIQQDEFSPSSITDSEQTIEEQEANIFAAFMLIPDKLLSADSDPLNRQYGFSPVNLFSRYLYPPKAIDLRRSLLPDNKKYLIFTQTERDQYLDEWQAKIKASFPNAMLSLPE
jgi:Zn-dependent peptidase ImmA (M78 family)